MASPAQALQNLPGLAANAAANAAADLGFGNLGWDNVGFFNSGVGNFGIFNNGQHNVGAYNKGDNNVGVGNNTPDKGYCAPNGQSMTPRQPSTETSARATSATATSAPSTTRRQLGHRQRGRRQRGLARLRKRVEHGNSNSGFLNIGSNDIGLSNYGTATSVQQPGERKHRRLQPGDQNIGYGITGDNMVGIGIPGTGVQFAFPAEFPGRSRARMPRGRLVATDHVHCRRCSARNGCQSRCGTTGSQNPRRPVPQAGALPWRRRSAERASHEASRG
ncbi:pentapeptide repeats family protein [Mycobacterium kansasii]|uniref:Pentapeptide repeats family protein n=1 Tax=Mycobacterium kansasii TaxID=1768 RepID=A0A1V3WAN0_MYCKA|nr:pentapeptide repeats family protein [Mycobacterium kansasii]